MPVKFFSLQASIIHYIADVVKCFRKNNNRISLPTSPCGKLCGKLFSSDLLFYNSIKKREFQQNVLKNMWKLLKIFKKTCGKVFCYSLKSSSVKWPMPIFFFGILFNGSYLKLRHDESSCRIPVLTQRTQSPSAAIIPWEQSLQAGVISSPLKSFFLILSVLS